MVKLKSKSIGGGLGPKSPRYGKISIRTISTPSRFRTSKQQLAMLREAKLKRLAEEAAAKVEVAPTPRTAEVITPTVVPRTPEQQLAILQERKVERLAAEEAEKAARVVAFKKIITPPTTALTPYIEKAKVVRVIEEREPTFLEKTKAVGELLKTQVGIAIPEVVKEVILEQMKETGRRQIARDEVLIEKFKSDQILTNWERNKLTNLGYIKKTGEGWSLTQKYFEIFGVEFYKPGERQRLVDEKSEELMPKYENLYQEAFDSAYLKKIEFREITFEEAKKDFSRSDAAKKIQDKYILEVGGTAPTNRWVNAAIGFLDLVLKGQVFAPYMATGVAAKQRTQGQRQIFDEYVKNLKKNINKLSKEEYNTLLARMGQGSSYNVRDLYMKALQSGNKNTIKDVEKIIGDMYKAGYDPFARTYTISISESNAASTAARFFKDIKQQEGLIAERLLVSTPKPIEQPTIFGVSGPTMPLVGEVVSGAGLVEKIVEQKVELKPDIKFFKPQTLKEKFELIKPGENIFFKTVPKGKIKDLGFIEGRIPSDILQPTKQKIKGEEKIKEKEKIKEVLKPKSIIGEKEITIPAISPAITTIIPTVRISPQVKTIPSIMTTTITVPKFKEAIKFDTRLDFFRPTLIKPKIKTTGIGKIPLPGKPTPTIKKRIKKRIIKKKAYMPQVKARGRYRNIALNPMKTVTQARDRVSFAKDNTTSASSRILTKKSYTKLSKPKGKEIGYYSRTKFKYRNYKIRKGKKIPLPNFGLIELRSKRIDTSGEKAGLKLAKLIKQRGWIIKPKKKSKGKF